jgi:class 3 adenylate cyclase
MEPRIQYAQTKDDVSIALYTLGQGVPLVRVPTMPWSHIQMEWQIPEFRQWNENTAEKRMLVRYDGRGNGLSEHNVTEYSVDALLLDLEAVVDHLDLERFALVGEVFGGLAAIAYSARYPERVSHLVLASSFARGSEPSRSSRMRAFTALRETDWELYTEAMAQFIFGWSGTDSASRYTALLRECATQEALQAFMASARGFDVTALLPQLKSPTLVLQWRQAAFPPVEVARELASRIPGARLALLEDAPYLSVSTAALAAIDEFLAEEEEESKTLAPEDVHTILFTDVEGSTALTQRLGDAKARAVLREHERIVREALKSHGGSEMKMTGDGFMASFTSAVRALESAIAMQRAFAAHNRSADEPIRVRVGMNAGEPIAEDDPEGRSDLFGAAVIRAARIAALAKGGEILVANVVRELAEGKEFLFSDRGEVTLRGFDDPVHLYELGWQEAK